MVNEWSNGQEVVKKWSTSGQPGVLPKFDTSIESLWSTDYGRVVNEWSTGQEVVKKWSIMVFTPETPRNHRIVNLKETKVIRKYH